MGRRSDQSIEVDASTPPEALHERVERLAVPMFDWVNEPITAIVEGVTHPLRGKHSTDARRQAGVRRSR